MPGSSHWDAPAMLLDASAKTIKVAVWSESKWLSYATVRGEALVDLLPLVERVFKESGMSLKLIKTILFCEGPGSVLGIRILAMTIRAWMIAYPGMVLYAWKSLELYAALLRLQGVSEGILVAPSRMKRWLTCPLARLGERTIQELSTEELLSLDQRVYYLDQRGVKFPREDYLALETDYEAYPELFANPDWLNQKELPDAWMLKQPVFKQWSGKRHRI